MKKIIVSSFLTGIIFFLSGCSPNSLQFYTKYMHEDSNLITSGWQQKVENFEDTAIYKEFTINEVSFVLKIIGIAGDINSTSDSKFELLLVPISETPGALVQILEASVSGSGLKVDLEPFKDELQLTDKSLVIHTDELVYAPKPENIKEIAILTHQELYELTEEKDGVLTVKCKVGEREGVLHFEIDRIEYHDIAWPT